MFCLPGKGSGTPHCQSKPHNQRDFISSLGIVPSRGYKGDTLPSPPNPPAIEGRPVCGDEVGLCWKYQNITRPFQTQLPTSLVGRLESRVATEVSLRHGPVAGPDLGWQRGLRSDFVAPQRIRSSQTCYCTYIHIYIYTIHIIINAYIYVCICVYNIYLSKLASLYCLHAYEHIHTQTYTCAYVNHIDRQCYPRKPALQGLSFIYCTF